MKLPRRSAVACRPLPQRGAQSKRLMLLRGLEGRNMSNTLWKTEGWRVRLYRTGQFSLQWNVREEAWPDGVIGVTYSEARGDSAAETFGAAAWRLPAQMLVPVRDVLNALARFDGEAVKRQRKYRARLSAAKRAADALGLQIDVAAEVAALAAMNGGAR